MNDQPSSKPRVNAASLVIGGILVLLGILFLIGQLFGVVFDIDIGQFTWPFFIIIPGVVLFISAFLLDPTAGRGLAIAGSIVTMVGAILLFQNTTGFWASWAYAWALIFPTSIGLGQLVYGALRGQGEMVRPALNMILIGIAIFLVGLFFFEGVIGISGFRLGLSGLCWPVLLIGLGLLVLLLNFLPGRKRT